MWEGSAHWVEGQAAHRESLFIWGLAAAGCRVKRQTVVGTASPASFPWEESKQIKWNTWPDLNKQMRTSYMALSKSTVLWWSESIMGDLALCLDFYFNIILIIKHTFNKLTAHRNQWNKTNTTLCQFPVYFTDDFCPHLSVVCTSTTFPEFGEFETHGDNPISCTPVSQPPQSHDIFCNPPTSTIILFTLSL